MIQTMTALFFVVLTGSPAGAATSCPAIDDIAESASERDFQQVRRLTGIPQPLVSSGTVIVEDDQIIWNVTDPLNVTTIISETGITESIEGGPASAVETGGGMNPLLTKGLFDVLGGDLTRASTYFSVEHLPNDAGRWRVRLVPKDPQVADYLAAMTVSGCTAIDTITTDQTSGDQMTITFQDG